MSKESVTAIIRAIQSTTALFVESGAVGRQPIIDPDEDAAAVQDLEDAYSSGIDEIVENIPDDPEPSPDPEPEPEPELRGYINADKSQSNIGVDSSKTLYDENGVAIPFDSSKNYAIQAVRSSDDTDLTWKLIYLYNKSGKLGVKNPFSGATIKNVSYIVYTE